MRQRALHLQAYSHRLSGRSAIGFQATSDACLAYAAKQYHSLVSRPLGSSNDHHVVAHSRIQQQQQHPSRPFEMVSRQSLAFQACIGHSLNRSDQYTVQEPLGEDFCIEDLPIKPLSAMGKTPSLTAFIEIIRNVGPLDDAERAAADISKLPQPWGYAGMTLPQHQVQIYTKPSDGGLDIVKLVQFTNRCYVPLIKAACRGEAYGLSKIPGQAIRLLQSAVHYIGSRMGGIVISNQTLDVPNKPVKNVIDIQAGFEYIRSNGPVGSDQNQNVEWTELERNRPESPIFGWQVGLVKESLANLTRAAQLSRLRLFFFLFFCFVWLLVHLCGLFR